MPDRRRPLTAALVATALAMLLPVGVAAAATAPGASTGAATRVTIQSATLNGHVNPRGLPTTFHFEYGATAAYTASTPAVAAGAGSSGVRAQADVAGLAAGTRYHYRLVAQSSAGITRGADRTFTTRAPRPAVTLSAVPNPVLFGAPVTLSGTVAGARIAGRLVQLRQSPFPFTARFAKVGNAIATDARGSFAITLPTVPLSTRFRVHVGGQPALVSRVVTIGVRPRIATRVTRTRVRRGGRVRFSGTVRPAEPNRPLAIQKRRRGRWITVAGMLTRPGRGDFVVYGKTIRVRRGGLYRVFVGNGSGATGPNASGLIRLHVSR